MADSIRKQIIAALVTKLGAILTTNGFQTSIGTNVYKVAKALDPGNVPLISIWPGDETAIKEYGYVVANMPVRIEAISNVSTNNPSDLVEKMLADLIECVTGAAWTIPFSSGGTTAIAVGNTITGATSAATGYVMGVTLSSGTWAGGNAAGTLTIRRKIGTFVAENLKVGALTLAATTGVLTYISDIQSSTNSLADSIEYSAGGAGDYPENKDLTVGAYAVFNIKYKYLKGNPYTQ